MERGLSTHPKLEKVMHDATVIGLTFRTSVLGTDQNSINSLKETQCCANVKFDPKLETIFYDVRDNNRRGTHAR